MKGFLEENATEVKNMVMGEWDMDTALEVAKEEGWEEGKEEGWEECLEDVLELVRQGYSAEMIERKLQNRKGSATTPHLLQ
jgi:flagellar biosynthesis/type III secretory pathway protein FliH